jgi:hypothetical protein
LRVTRFIWMYSSFCDSISLDFSFSSSIACRYTDRSF